MLQFLSTTNTGMHAHHSPSYPYKVSLKIYCNLNTPETILTVGLVSYINKKNKKKMAKGSHC